MAKSEGEDCYVINGEGPKNATARISRRAAHMLPLALLEDRRFKEKVAKFMRAQLQDRYIAGGSRHPDWESKLEAPTTNGP